MAQRNSVGRPVDNGSGGRNRPSLELPEPDGAEQSSATERDLLENDTEQEEAEMPARECPVCLQPCINAVRLPCSHIFCYLCVKGVMGHGRRACSLCRAEVPASYLLTPTLVDGEEILGDSQDQAIEGRYLWYYEGRRGWWQYDNRAASELEEKYQAGAKRFELMIAGFSYVVDLDGGFQYRKQYPTRRRNIKRDLVDIPDKRGVAGIVCRPTPRGATVDPLSRSGGDGGEREGDLNIGGAASSSDLNVTGGGASSRARNNRDDAIRDIVGTASTEVSDLSAVSHSNDDGSLSDISVAALATTSAPTVAPLGATSAPLAAAADPSATALESTAIASSATVTVSNAGAAAISVENDVLAERFRTMSVIGSEEREEISDGTERNS